MKREYPSIKIGLAGYGALGSIIGEGLTAGAAGAKLIGIAEIRDMVLPVPRMDFSALAENADVVIEALPPDVVPELAREVLPAGKKLWLLSAAALLRFPEIMAMAAPGQIGICAGALTGVDGVRAFALRGIRSATLVSMKPPHALAGAPYVVEHKLNMATVTSALRIFLGSALDAANGFPANTNVAATLALACRPPGQRELFNIQVEIWADPAASGNAHKIRVETHDGAVLESEIFSPPSPQNPKSSPQAAYAMLSHLHCGGGVFAI
jgi:aspartate dehydrogenase